MWSGHSCPLPLPLLLILILVLILVLILILILVLVLILLLVLLLPLPPALAFAFILGLHPLNHRARSFPNFSAAASRVSSFLQNANRTCRAPSRASR